MAKTNNASALTDQQPGRWGEQVTRFEIDLKGNDGLEVWSPANVCQTLAERYTVRAEGGDGTAAGATVTLISRGRRVPLGTVDLNSAEGWDQIRATYAASLGKLPSSEHSDRRFALEVLEWHSPGQATIHSADGVPRQTAVDLPVSGWLSGQACLAYAMATLGEQHELRESGTKATAAALRIAAAIGNDRAVGPNDFKAFVDQVPGCTVTVLDADAKVLSRAGGDEPADGRPKQHIYLLKQRNYYYIPRIEAFAAPGGQSTWCHPCARLYPRGTVRGHVCAEQCTVCHHYFSSAADRERHRLPVTAANAACQFCNQSFRYSGCHDWHRCEMWKCPQCDVRYPLPRMANHVCGEQYCAECDEYTDSKHRCFARPTTLPSPTGPTYAVGLKKTADASIAVVVAMRLGTRATRVFQGVTACSEFLSWACAPRPAAAIFVAHGLINTLLDSIVAAGLAPRAVKTVDGKTVQVDCGGARFLNSRRLCPGLPGRLRTSTAAFFPEAAFTADNLEFAGEVPRLEYFGSALAKRSSFLGWHSERQLDGLSGDQYVLLDEAVKQCRSNVEAFCIGLEKLSAAAMSIRVDLFATPTAAEFARTFYRSKHMAPNTAPLLTPLELAFINQLTAGTWTEIRQVVGSWPAQTVAAGGGAVCVEADMHLEALKCDPLPVGSPWWHDRKLEGRGECEAFLRELAASRRCAVIECDVVCPRVLHHPVLLTRRSGRICAALDVRRGTWTSVELERAREKGYRVVNIYGALCSETSTALFTRFIDYAQELRRNTCPATAPSFKLLGEVLLAGLRAAMTRSGSTTAEAVCVTRDDEIARLLSRLHDGDVDRLDVLAKSDTCLVVKPVCGAEEQHAVYDSMVRAFVGAHARMRVHTVLDLLGPRVLYHSGCTIVYERSTRGYNVAVDAGLWHPGPKELGAPLVEFCGLGPGAFAVRTLAGKERAFGPCSVDACRAAMLGFLASSSDGALGTPSDQFKAQYMNAGAATRAVDPLVELQTMAIVSAERSLPHGHLELDRYVDETSLDELSELDANLLGVEISSLGPLDSLDSLGAIGLDSLSGLDRIAELDAEAELSAAAASVASAAGFD